MSLKEAERLSMMQQIDKKFLTLRKGSEELGLSLRQMKRVRKRYLEQGKRGLIYLKRGKESNRKFSPHFRYEVVKLMKEKYVDFGPTIATEKLEELCKERPKKAVKRVNVPTPWDSVPNRDKDPQSDEARLCRRRTNGGRVPRDQAELQKME